MSNYKFYVQMERERYNCFLPNEILLIILNQLHRVSLSLVSYQFYITNKYFVSQCYHLNRYLPLLDNVVHQYGQQDMSPKLCVIQINHINYEYEFKLYKINNMTHMTYCNLKIQGRLFDNVLQLMSYDPYICGQLYTIFNGRLNREYDYPSLLEMNDYVNLLELFDKNRIEKLIQVFLMFKNSSKLNIFNQLMACFDEHELFVRRVFIKILNEKKGMSSTDFLNQLDVDKFFTSIVKEFPSLDKLMNVKDGLYKIMNCKVDHDCLYFMNEYGNPLVQINQCHTPAYQWLAQQLCK